MFPILCLDDRRYPGHASDDLPTLIHADSCTCLRAAVGIQSDGGKDGAFWIPRANLFWYWSGGLAFPTDVLNVP